MNKLLETDLERHGEYGKLYVDIMIRKFLDAGIQDISMSISLDVIIQKNLNDLTERCESHNVDTRA